MSSTKVITKMKDDLLLLQERGVDYPTYVKVCLMVDITEQCL